jgi:GNAT superfamily N-acetyltransferase
MGDELVMRPMQERDTDGILNLLKLSLGGGSVPRTLEYWSWKHHQNPFGRSAAIIAESAGEIVGLRVFMRWNWETSGKILRSVRAVDTATHPSWRGQGIFSRLTLALVEQMRDEQVAFVFNTPNEFSRPGYLKMGWTDLGRVSLWIRPRVSGRLTRDVLQRIWRKSGTEQKPVIESGFPHVSDLLRHDEMIEFAEPQRLNGPSLQTSMNVQYIEWRYANNPGFAYFTTWKCSNDGAAAIIFRESRRGNLRELRLCQILLNSSPSSSSVAKHLISEVIKKSRPDYAVGMSTAANERKALLGAGFIPLPRAGPIFTVRQLNETPETAYLFDRSAWSLCIGDLELF